MTCPNLTTFPELSLMPTMLECCANSTPLTIILSSLLFLLLTNLPIYEPRIYEFASHESTPKALIIIPR